MHSMIAEDLLNQMIPPLKLTDSTEKAARWLEEFHVGQLPVLENRQFRGLITEADLLDQDKPNQLLSDVPFGYAQVHVQHDQHFYSIIEVAVQNRVQLVPVLDDQQEYLGLVTVSDTLAAFGKVPVATGQQGIIVLVMEERDYSLSQISRYVEENNAKIMSAHVAQDEHDQYKIRLTLKLNTPNLTRIIATLERFGYSITAQFSGTAEVSEDEQERFDALLKYLSL
ncbi:CBS domain-containing protein [Hymenobacter taeanensis]|uniref:CBS domain-containing protein n=1 Tax=Hymenobacter taeanensis TaxID=2735321 RepID=A0A6M6BH30_9BACT|nr:MULTISPECIES: CBS domain-containing protein [Hymenobacter]QJX47134.1 CBS domain-containing protein [Hymenobacter taeanensis]UOQ81049.1 CBS domain-containing protein [Hymenobacter sp. 5414T-23]